MSYCAKTILAYLALAYLLSCVFYLIASRFAGSPWAETVRRLPPDVVAVRKRSSKTRSTIFVVSAIVSLLIVGWWSPF